MSFPDRSKKALGGVETNKISKKNNFIFTSSNPRYQGSSWRKLMLRTILPICLLFSVPHLLVCVFGGNRQNAAHSPEPPN